MAVVFQYVNMILLFFITLHNLQLFFIFRDILNQQMNSDVTLGGNESTTDCILCSCIADINMDGRNEILLGTYKQEVLIFASIDNTWKMIDKKLFDAPVHSISYLDLAGDGVKVLVVLTQRSVHIMQVNILIYKNLMKFI